MGSNAGDFVLLFFILVPLGIAGLVACARNQHYKSLPAPATPEEAEQRRKDQRNERIGLAVATVAVPVAAAALCYRDSSRQANRDAAARAMLQPAPPVLVPVPVQPSALNGYRGTGLR